MESQKRSETKSSDILTAVDYENLYKEAYRLVDKGITLMTEGRNDEASKVFQEGILCLDRALETKVETFDVGAEKVQLYAEMQIKMRCTRKEVLSHFSDAQIGTGSTSYLPARDDAPPSYEESMSLQYQGYSESPSLANEAEASYPSLNNLRTPDLSPKNGELVLHIDDGVQIFFINPDGNVTSPSLPTFLAVVMFTDDASTNASVSAARGFLQVGEWNYPLVPSRSPVLHAFYGAYMFPDLTNSIKDSGIGVIIPDTCSKDEKELFEQILQEMTSYRHQDRAEAGARFGDVDPEKINKSASYRIAEGLITGAQAVAHGVVWGAEKLSELIASGSEKLRKTSQPTLHPTPVDPKWQNTAKTARHVSGKAVKVSGFILNQLGKATMAIGRKVAPVIQRQSTKAIGRITGQSDTATGKQVDGVMEVASGAVRGAATIYLGLEKAAYTLAGSLTENTVKVVTHKYGDDMGSLTDNTLHAVGQTAAVGYHVSSMGVKGIAKRAAKDTGRALVENYHADDIASEAVDLSANGEKKYPR